MDTGVIRRRRRDRDRGHTSRRKRNRMGRRRDWTQRRLPRPGRPKLWSSRGRTMTRPAEFVCAAAIAAALFASAPAKAQFAGIDENQM